MFEEQENVLTLREDNVLDAQSVEQHFALFLKAIVHEVVYGDIFKESVLLRVNMLVTKIPHPLHREDTAFRYEETIDGASIVAWATSQAQADAIDGVVGAAGNEVPRFSMCNR